VSDLDLKRCELSSNGLHVVRAGRTALLLCLLQAVWVGACASQPVVPTDYSAARERMVEELAAPGRGIKNHFVLNAVNTVPRHEFVPQSLRQFAYRDGPLPIGYGQTISQPFVVAFMTEQLDPKPTDRILEIGTGSGYQAAVLSRLVAEVYTIEIIEPLAKRAEADLKRLSDRTRRRSRFHRVLHPETNHTTASGGNAGRSFVSFEKTNLPERTA
jgi:hypothetical protein